MAGVLNNRNGAYQHADQQENKSDSIKASKKLVKAIQNKVKSIDGIQTCEQYEPSQDLRIHNAPAVRLPNEKLVIAPDLKCTTNDGKIFWIEVKDKCQRFFRPDTGADLHQILGFYQINNILNEPVLMIFRDDTLQQCYGKNADDSSKTQFKKRWDLFQGEPYGNWIDQCILPSNPPRYPLLSFEKSRGMHMYIFYFHVNNLKTIDFESIPYNIPSKSANSSIMAYRKNVDDQMELHAEEDLKMLSIENLTLVTSPQRKYENIPIVDVAINDLEILATRKNSYQQSAQEELLRRQAKILHQKI